MVNFGTRAATAVISLVPYWVMPPAPVLWPTMKPVMFCGTGGMPRWQANPMKCAPLLRSLGEEDPVVGQDGDRIAVQVGEAVDQGGAASALNSSNSSVH